MKTIKSTLVVILATFALLASLAAATAVSVNAPPSGDNDGADLILRPDGGTYETGQTIEILANFPTSTAGHSVSLYKETTAGSDTYEVEEVDSEANGTGNAYFHPAVDAGARKYYAEDDVNGDQTEVKTITGEAAVPPTGTLTASTDRKTFTATFSPAASAQPATLKTREICTYETDETNPASGPFDKSVPQADCVGPLKTVATGTQNSTGRVTFTLSNPLEVNHKYQAFSGSTSTPIIEAAAPLPKNPYGTDTGLSELHFNTYEGDDVDTRTRYFEGEFSMTASDKSVNLDGNGPTPAAPCAEVPGIKKSVMKGRGNYSWTFPKKSFTLKTGDKKALCGMGNSKKWALVANDYDKSLLRNTLASYVGQKFSNMGWTPRAVPVEFYMNGSYRGSYILIERIGVESTRVAIDELNGDDPAEQEEPGITGGYVLEWDFRHDADYNVNLGTRGYIGVKEPENDYDREGDPTTKGISSDQKSYINGYLHDADDALYASNFTSDVGGWQKYIDMASAVDYYIAMEYMKPVDGNMWASVYMYKPRGGKLKFGPMWDFDLAAGSANRAGNVVSSSSWYLRNNLGVSAQQTSKTWFNRLNEDQEFRDAVDARWNQIQDTLNVAGFLDDQKSLITQSATANFKRWSHSSRISEYQIIKSSWSSDVTYLRGWATGRKSWINGQL